MPGSSGSPPAASTTRIAHIRVEPFGKGLREARRHVLRDEDRRRFCRHARQHRLDRLRAAGRGADRDDAVPTPRLSRISPPPAQQLLRPVPLRAPGRRRHVLGSHARRCLRRAASSPTDAGPPGLARTSMAPARSASIVAADPGCVSELMMMTGIGRCAISLRRKLSRPCAASRCRA